MKQGCPKRLAWYSSNKSSIFTFLAKFQITHFKKLEEHNVIEQVTDFKYLEYRISEGKSDLEDKLQTYIKINGAIRRHFGKQMNKETKLRIHNITAKAALKFGNEAWVLKKREEQRLEAAQMKFLKHLLGITKLDKEKNQCVREKLGVQNIVKELKQYQQKWTQIEYQNKQYNIDQKDEGT
jgi:hypothetical protein